MTPKTCNYVPWHSPVLELKGALITSFYGSSCANNSKDALNTPEYVINIRVDSSGVPQGPQLLSVGRLTDHRCPLRRGRGSTDGSRLRHFFDAHYFLVTFWGQPNSPAAEWLNKGSMSLPSKSSAKNWGEN
eukprot:7776164-Pyramimonas_sp.AAC.1